MHTVLSLALNASMTVATPSEPIYTAFHQETHFSAHHEKVVAHFNSENETYALESMWSSPTTLIIGALKNSSINFQQQADQACETINRHGLYHPELNVRIINYARLIALGHHETLGTRQCPYTGP
ncbi:hypothetical protein [Neptuniibacter halophilus]|uniref:hypothetical protein n=1 Tax=Neptuniibacter halophilus TaxID=651666 RepID=UPI0025732F69|nr:hypothetical protein [Neptuniibacter halophilus]